MWKRDDGLEDEAWDFYAVLAAHCLGSHNELAMVIERYSPELLAEVQYNNPSRTEILLILSYE